MGQTPQTEDRPDWFRPDVKEEIEPLVDIISIDCAIKVVALLPGVEKEDIRLRATEDALIILVDTSKRGYYKEVKLHACMQSFLKRSSNIKSYLNRSLVSPKYWFFKNSPLYVIAH